MNQLRFYRYPVVLMGQVDTIFTVIPYEWNHTEFNLQISSILYDDCPTVFICRYSICCLRISSGIVSEPFELLERDQY